jgi:hypothetical protein
MSGAQLAAGLLVVLVLAGGGLCAADYGAEATVVDKQCPQVTARTHIGSIEVTRRVSGISCALVQPGDRVVYHVRSGDLEYEPR